MTVDPIAVDARGVVEIVFPRCWCVRQWRALDAGGKVPQGFRVGGRKLWRTADLRRWSEWGFPDRRTYNVKTTALENAELSRGAVDKLTVGGGAS